MLGRFYDWATDPDTPVWQSALAVSGALIAAFGAITGIIFGILVLTHASLDCPEGQQAGIVSYITIPPHYVPGSEITIGKMTEEEPGYWAPGSIQPVWGCIST